MEWLLWSLTSTPIWGYITPLWYTFHGIPPPTGHNLATPINTFPNLFITFMSNSTGNETLLQMCHRSEASCSKICHLLKSHFCVQGKLCVCVCIRVCEWQAAGSTSSFKEQCLSAGQSPVMRDTLQVPPLECWFWFSLTTHSLERPFEFLSPN